ncbi:MAG TPA: hypothetical protein VJX67_10380, partial [Blastocatellia bacterium]|nr:hypothetical protein [Blastocatellia bacterium]
MIRPAITTVVRRLTNTPSGWLIQRAAWSRVHKWVPGLVAPVILLGLTVASGSADGPGAGARFHRSAASHAKNAAAWSRGLAGRTGLAAAAVSSVVQVPGSMRYGPFTVPRSLAIPAGFSISVYARIPDARFMAVAANGDLLVSQPDQGKVSLVRPNPGGDPSVHDFATRLTRPHSIVFHTVKGVNYIYIAETNQIDRFVYNDGDLSAHDEQTVVTGLPDSSTPGIGGYAHELKNIALDANDNLYVSIGSSCNVCTDDSASSPVRAAIYQYGADGSSPRLFARGLRNAEGLAFVPGTGDLWAVVNERDDIAYPFNDSTGQYGQVIPSYVDNHPPDELTRVRDGGNYGWPFCNPDPDTANGMDNPPFDPDNQLNGAGQVDCGPLDRISKGIQAHSAPLGLVFLQNTSFAEAYRSGAAVALHGSWNRQNKTGYKVIYFPWDGSAQAPGSQMDLVTGWLDGSSQKEWGRPVGLAVDSQGELLISDDLSGTIYKL